MEINTVHLSLFEYNSLKEFRDNIEKNHTYYIIDYAPTWNTMAVPLTNRFITTDEAIKIIAEKNSNLQKKIHDLQNEVNILKHPKQKEITISELKQLSFWKLYKWWRKK